MEEKHVYCSVGTPPRRHRLLKASHEPEGYCHAVQCVGTDGRAFEDGMYSAEEDRGVEIHASIKNTMGRADAMDAGCFEEESIGKQRDPGGRRPHHGQPASATTSPRSGLPTAVSKHRIIQKPRYYDLRVRSCLHGRVVRPQQRGAGVSAVGRG